MAIDELPEPIVPGQTLIIAGVAHVVNPYEWADLDPPAWFVITSPTLRESMPVVF